MRVLGIDTGYAITGWAIMDKDIKHTNGIKLIDFGVFVTKPDISISARLHKINEHLDELIDKYKPEHMAVEELFYFKNKKTVINVSQARGVILLTGEKRGLNIFGY